MRQAIAVFSLALAVVALIWASYSFWQSLTRSQEIVGTSAQTPGVAAPDPGDGEAPAEVPKGASRVWPPMFGVPGPPTPQIAETDPTPEPPSRTLPKTDPAEGYYLKGLVNSDDMSWAIVAGDGGDLLVREDDTLPNDARVTAILPDRVRVTLNGQEGEIAFRKNVPIELTVVPKEAFPEDVPAATAGPKVRTQSLTPEELRDIILKANAQRGTGRVSPSGRPEDR